MKKALAYITLCILILISSACSNEEKEREHGLQLIEAAQEKVIQAVEEAKMERVILDDATNDAISQYTDVISAFDLTPVRKACAQKFAQLNSDGDVGRLMDFLAFLSINYASSWHGEEGYDICFSDDYITKLVQRIDENRESLKARENCKIDKYIEKESFVYIAFTYSVDGKSESSNYIFGNSSNRKEHHETYKSDSVGYFLVDETVLQIDDPLKNKVDKTKDIECPKCGRGYRGNSKRAEMIREHGYCGYGNGLCTNDS